MTGGLKGVENMGKKECPGNQAFFNYVFVFAVVFGTHGAQTRQ